MTNHAASQGNWGRRLSWAALALTVGGLVAALVAAAGSGADLWSFRTGFTILRYAFYAAMAGGVLAIIAFFIGRRAQARTGRLNLAALVIAASFGLYLMSHVTTAKRVPAIHDVTTDLADMPQFRTLAVRADNLENIPDEGRPELAALDPQRRWEAIHRKAYGDLRGVRLAAPPAAALGRVEKLAQSRGWDVAKVDPQAGILEATATTRFFRFKDDVVVRVRPDPGQKGGSIVDMRSISRVGGSDVGVNATRIREFLADLQAG
ncbi:MAG: DUF1499 domain-containing protein [Sphingomonas sp.]|nr:DUF1499 domain-containing protein [Sphingomonas sp.]